MTPPKILSPNQPNTARVKKADKAVEGKGVPFLERGREGERERGRGGGEEAKSKGWG